MMNEKMKILLNQLRFHAFHGVLPQEQTVGNEYEVDVELTVAVTPEMLAGELAGTVSYADVYAVVKREMNMVSPLLEQVADRITSSVLGEFSTVESVKVRVCKIAPPTNGFAGRSCGVEMERKQETPFGSP